MATSSVTNELWSAWLLRGIVMVIFGIAAVFWPGITLLTIIYLFSAFILISGIVTLVHGLLDMNRTMSWFLTVLLGVFESGVGVYMLRHTSLKFTTLILLIGFVLIARGVVDIVAAFLEQATSTAMTMAGLGGLLALVAGVIMLFQKSSGGVSFVWIIGLYAILVGALTISSAIDGHRMIDKK